MSKNLSQQWLNRAAEDLVVAQLVLQEEHASHACFLAQQCIEKALKAYLIAIVNEYPRTHGLVTLLELCVSLNPDFDNFHNDCAVVDQYYIPMCYPDSTPSGLPGGLPGETEAKEAIIAAEALLRFVTELLS